MTVALDTEITPELLLEGVEREITSKIQTMRKEAGFEVTDRIKVYFNACGNAKKVFESRGDELKKSVLAVELIPADSVSGYAKTWKVGDEEVTIGVERV